MVKRRLVIDRDDQGNFVLSVEAGTMTLGANSRSFEAVLRDLHISRIHCEIEVSEDHVVICKPGSTSGSPAGAQSLQELRLGESVQIGRARLRLEDVATEEADGSAAAERPVLANFSDKLLGEEVQQPAPAAPAPADAGAETSTMDVRLGKRLFVVDGADQGHAFLLPEKGTVTIGKSTKDADVVLHDLYLARIHCQLEIDGDHIVVRHLHGDNGTLVNGQRIKEQTITIGDIIRVGNEHLRLETVLLDESQDESEEMGSGVEGVEETDGVELLEGETEEVELVEEGEAEVEVVEEEQAQPAASNDPYALPHPPVDQLRELEGQTLGYYQLGPLLGRGHTSLVFRTLDGKNKQLVALKVMSPDFPSSDAELQRFVKALKVWAHLRRPHLVSLYGAGKTGPYCWLAREYIEGESLVRLVQRLKESGRLGWERAIRVAIHLGKALDFLHKNRVAHGNLTPRNVLIQKSDQVTKLADLMLNQALEGSKLQKLILGKKLLAELPYLAPEQTDPHAPGTPLGDLYSLGAVLYYLLTGEPPFTGETPREVAARIRAGKLVRPRKLQRDIPAPLDAAVLMLMARRPEERFQTATEFLAAIEPIAAEQEIEV
jgi:serine/threonine-protein kinase